MILILMVTAIVFIIILGVLIFVHELGHFVTAIKNGIRAEEFGFGFPPRIIGLQRYYRNNKTKKWRWIIGNKDGDSLEEFKDHQIKEMKKLSSGTIYSLNWIPLGGFVKIKGENGEKSDEPDSFMAKGPWIRIMVLVSGVLMNFILAWFLISAVLMIGAPEPASSDNVNQPGSKILISQVAADSPAETMGLKIGDEIAKSQPNFVIDYLSDVKKYIESNKGREIELKIKRGNQIIYLKGTPRLESQPGEGDLGIGYDLIINKKYLWYAAIWNGLRYVCNITILILVTFFGILKNLLMGESVSVDVAGPVGIAVLTKQVTTLGLIYIIQFAALLSINLGIINLMPFPALDGGRILFILIEKIKGRPVSRKLEQSFHTVGFIVLIALMILITFHDVGKFIFK